MNMQTAEMDSLVSASWLNDHLQDPDLVIFDCSVHTDVDAEGNPKNRSGQADYEAAHIPGAVFADLTTELSDAEAEIEFAVPSPEYFCTAMGALGVGDDSRVVLYDSFLNAWAARVWWMLRWVGFDRAAILDGGINAWKEAGYELSSDPSSNPARTLTPKVRPELIADRAEVQAAIDDESVHLIDTLPESSYNGEESVYDRPGHIPTAENICGIYLLDESGCYRPTEEIAAMHGGDPKERYITYCGGGILASSSAFAMTRIGFDNVAVYTASLQEWASDPSNPMTITD